MNNPNFLPHLYDIVVISMAMLVFLSSFFLMKKPRLPYSVALVLCIFAIIVMGLVPADASAATDRERYTSLFLYGESRTITDIGFLLFVDFCSVVFGNNFHLFFLFTASVYLLGYYSFIKVSSPREMVPVMLIGCLASFGFFSYNVNVLRSGLALSFFLLGFSSFIKKKRIWGYSMMALAGLIHFSLFIVAFALWFASSKLSLKWYYLIWILFLILSIINISAPLTDLISAIENQKMMRYMTIDPEYYKAGFRVDFLLFSMIPIVVGAFYYYGCQYKEALFVLLYKHYILLNSIWLLFIRIPYTDRVAYLSWFLIPFILLLPTYNQRVKPLYMGSAFIFLIAVKILL